MLHFVQGRFGVCNSEKHFFGLKNRFCSPVPLKALIYQSSCHRENAVLTFLHMYKDAMAGILRDWNDHLLQKNTFLYSLPTRLNKRLLEIQPSFVGGSYYFKLLLEWGLVLGVGKYRKVLAAKEDPSADHGPLLKKIKCKGAKYIEI